MFTVGNCKLLAEWIEWTLLILSMPSGVNFESIFAFLIMIFAALVS